MFGAVRKDVREIIRTLCGYKDVEILEGNVCIDHVHLCVKIPPKTSVSEFMGYLKGKSALMIFDMHPEYKQKQGGRHFWARGYYVDTVGRNEEQILARLQAASATSLLSIKAFHCIIDIWKA